MMSFILPSTASYEDPIVEVGEPIVVYLKIIHFYGLYKCAYSSGFNRWNDDHLPLLGAESMYNPLTLGIEQYWTNSTLAPHNSVGR